MNSFRRSQSVTILFLSLELYLAYVEGECRQLSFRASLAFTAKRLQNHTIRTQQVPDVNSCERLCFWESNCVSINFKEKNGSCELNNATDRRYGYHLEDDADYVYHGADSACDVNPCHNKFTCQSGFTDQRYRCVCAPGFTGEDCGHDIDECSVFPSICDINAICGNSEGSYLCSCKEGFAGDGKACKDIDECSVFPSICDINAICRNSEGSYLCSCKEGFAGDGKACEAYETVGCYKDTANRTISSLEGQDPILDGPITKRENAISKCASAAIKAGFIIFAIQDGGRCFSSATAPQTFDKYGESNDCQSDGEGGRMANHVYYIKGYVSVGCYRDTSDRAILALEGMDLILDRFYKDRKNAIAKCAVAAIRAGYSMFGVQDGGWCASSASAPQTFDKYGQSNDCGADGEGGPLANHVYTVI